jgi:hypothetical protein
LSGPKIELLAATNPESPKVYRKKRRGNSPYPFDVEDIVAEIAFAKERFLNEIQKRALIIS